MVTEDLHPPKTVTDAQAQAQTYQTVFPWALSRRQHIQADHKPTQRQESSTKRRKRSGVALVIKLGPVKVTKLIRG